MAWTITLSASSQSRSSSYRMAAMRRAAGHPRRDGIDETTSNTGDLVNLTVTVAEGGADRENVHLYFTAADMYLRGWGNAMPSPDNLPRVLFELGGYDLARRVNHPEDAVVRTSRWSSGRNSTTRSRARSSPLT